MQAYIVCRSGTTYQAPSDRKATDFSTKKLLGACQRHLPTASHQLLAARRSRRRSAGKAAGVQPGPRGVKVPPPGKSRSRGGHHIPCPPPEAATEQISERKPLFREVDHSSDFRMGWVFPKALLACGEKDEMYAIHAVLGGCWGTFAFMDNTEAYDVDEEFATAYNYIPPAYSGTVF